MPLDSQCGGGIWPWTAVRQGLFGVALRDFRACGFGYKNTGGSGECSDLGRVPVGKPLFDDPGAGAVPVRRRDQPVLFGWPAVPPDGASD